MSSDIAFFFKNPLVQFFARSLGLFALWFFLYELWLKPLASIDLYLIDKIITQSSWILETLGYELIPDTVYDTEFRTMGIDGTHGVWIGDPCNGLSIFALFAGFIIAFPGKIIRKTWFIPSGILTIHLLNVIRVSALSVILLESPESLDFNHSYVFTTVIYVYIFFLWYLWADKLSQITKEA